MHICSYYRLSRLFLKKKNQQDLYIRVFTTFINLKKKLQFQDIEEYQGLVGTRTENFVSKARALP